MKRVITPLLIISALTLTACGGGSGSGGSPSTLTQQPATKASTKAYLFGAMSSNSTIATVETGMTVPAGIMVNYSSAPGASGVFPLRKGVIVPSGPVKLADSDISGTFNTANRKLRISLLNNPATLKQLKSSKTGNGEEILTLNFDLATPDVKTALPETDPLVVVGQDRGGNSVKYLGGCQINFATEYQ